MSAFDDAEGSHSARWSDVVDACSSINEILANGDGDQIPMEVAQNLLTSATLLFAHMSQGGRRSIEAFRPDVTVTPTDVVVTVSAMLRAAELNSFDLAMWFTARPADV